MAAALPLLGGVTGLLVSKAISKPAAQTATQSTPAPTPMPVADDMAIKQARKKALIQQMARSGRSSTMLTPDSGSLLGA